MKKVKVSTIIFAVIAIFAVVMVSSPDTKAWVSRGLMKIGLFKPDLDNGAKPDGAAGDGEEFSETAAVTGAYFLDEEGSRIDAANQAGKVVFINFWATWCPPCIAEMPSIDKLYRQFKDNDQVVFLIVDVDGKMEQSKDFMAKRKLNLPVHIPAGDIPAQWLDSSIPTTVILDKKGQLATRHEGMADYSKPEVADFINGLIEE